MDTVIRRELALSTDEYAGLLDTLRARLGLTDITDITCLSAALLASIADLWEAAVVERLADIVAAHVGVEKLHRSQPRALACPEQACGNPACLDPV
jgi:hypothetical protein